MLTTVLAIAAILVGLLCTLVTIVMLCAGAANASPTKMKQITWFLVSIVFVQLLSLVSSIAMLCVGRNGFACGAGVMPVLYDIVLVAVLVILEF